MTTLTARTESLPESVGVANTPAEYRAFLEANNLPRPEARPVAVKSRLVGDFVTIYVSPIEVLVSSVSDPNTYRIVDPLHGTCSCPAGTFGKKCHHLEPARVTEDIERNEAAPVHRPAVMEQNHIPANMYEDTPTKEAWLPKPICSVEGCTKPVHLILGKPARTCCAHAIQLED